MAVFNLHFHIVWTCIKKLPFLLSLHFSLIWSAVKHLPSTAFVDILHIIIMLGCAAVYMRRVDRLQGLLGRAAGQKQISSFNAFNRLYCSESFQRMVICGGVLIGSAILFMAQCQQPFPNASNWGVVETSLCICVVYTLSGLALMRLFTDGLWSIAASPKRIERWMDDATLSLDNKYFNIAIALATPDAWTKAGAFFLVASLLASKLPVTQSVNQEGKGSPILRYFALGVGAVIVIHSLFMAYVFRRLTPPMPMNEANTARRRRTRWVPA